MIRHKTKIIKIGHVRIGGRNPIAIQSMAKTKTADIEKTIRQIKALEGIGCEIVRVAVKDSLDAKAIKKIKNKIKLPIVADIHFNWRLAIDAIDNGADKIRLNPGNIYKRSEIKEIIGALKIAKIPLRVGVNSGSVKDLNSKSLSMPDKLVKSALNYIKTLEDMKFYDIVVSLKASNVLDTIEAYQKMAKFCDYPLHLGVTATGLPYSGAIKSSIAIGALLVQGIGDTIRISLTDSPTEEVKTAKAILESLNLRHFGPEIISCPTCGRCEVNLIKIVKDLENRLSTIDYRLSTRPIKLAVMGCVVNGPGEAGEADIGIAFGKAQGLLFRNGKAIKKIGFSESINSLLKEMESLNA
jgi:(E)-4-hydroxy-3-methylbut-2-enyl-diphosphate synthase